MLTTHPRLVNASQSVKRVVCCTNCSPYNCGVTGGIVLSVNQLSVSFFSPFRTSKANSSHLRCVAVVARLFVDFAMSNTKCLEGVSRQRFTISFRFICSEFECGFCLNCHCRSLVIPGSSRGPKGSVEIAMMAEK